MTVRELLDLLQDYPAKSDAVLRGQLRDSQLLPIEGVEQRAALVLRSDFDRRRSLAVILPGDVR
jgi:hypothetical protein